LKEHQGSWGDAKGQQQLCWYTWFAVCKKPVLVTCVAVAHPLLCSVLDMFKKQSTKPYDRQAVLGILPFELKAKILRHLYAGAIRDVPLLRNIADDDLFMTDMCIRLQPYTCSANTFVYQRGKGWCLFR
jgi:hypothetical protein